MAKYKITLDKDACIGCGACASVCPKLFELNEDEMKAHAKKADIDDADAKCANEAADSCPAEAIKVAKQ